jgi:hypothetical protein
MHMTDCVFFNSQIHSVLLSSCLKYLFTAVKLNIMTNFIEAPAAISTGKDIVSFLHTVQPGVSLRIRTKISSLDEEYVYATATRHTGAWEVFVDGAESSETITDDNEADTLMSTDNWDLGWYSFAPPASATPVPSKEMTEKGHRECSAFSGGTLLLEAPKLK